ncbi:MAG: hypothetical protein ABIR96_04715 [Bdellovibrionota bacterium]
MKITKILMSAVLVGGLAGASVSQAAQTQNASAQQLSAEIARISMTVHQLEIGLAVQNVINWQVGEFHNLTIKLSLPFPGTGHKEVAKEDTARNAIWYNQDIAILGQNQKVETLMDRATGKVLEQIVNGKKEEVSNDDKIEILEQYESTVEVPAGKFDCMYVKAKVTSKGQTQEIEAWINPIDVNMDGMLKVKLQSQMGPVEMLLKDFGKK